MNNNVEKTKQTKRAKRANGEGLLRYDDTLGYWVAKVTGNPKPIYGKTKQEAIQRREQFKLSGGKSIKSITLKEAIQKGIDYKYDTGLIGDNTYYTNICTFNTICESDIANKKLEEITVTELQDYLASIVNYSDSTIKKIYEELNLGYNYAKSTNLISTNIMKENIMIRKPKSEQKKEKVLALEFEEEKKLITTIKSHPHQYSNIWLLSLYTGLRIGEIMALEKTDIDLKKLEVHVHQSISRTKNGKEKLGKVPKTVESNGKIPIVKNVKEILVELLENSNENSIFLVSKEDGNWISPKAVYSAFKRYIENYKICKKCTLHMLRHSYATRLIEADVPPKVIQHLLRHKSIQTTLDTYADVFKRPEDKYTDVIDENINELNEIVELDQNKLAINELERICSIVQKSHFTEAQKELLNNDLKKISEWLELA